MNKATQQQIPTVGALRVDQICGNKNTRGILPICKTSWWNGVRRGIYPQPFKLNERTTVWDAELIAQVAKGTYEGLQKISPDRHKGRKPKQVA